MKLPAFLPLFARAWALACLLAGGLAAAQESVTLLLGGAHSFRYAGYYAAQELGYYKEEGLDVRFAVPDAAEDPVDAVLSGKAAFGVGSSRLLVARGQGKPVVVLAVIFQQSEESEAFYGDNLFTSEQQLKSEKRVASFREASLRGWRYAMENRDKAIDLVMRRSGGDRTRADLVSEAGRVSALVRPDLVEIGQMSATRWRKIAEAYIDMKLLPASASLEGFTYRRPDARADLERVYALLAAALALVVAAVGMVAYIQRVNSRLRLTLSESEATRAALAASEERIRLLADHASDVIWTRDLDGRFTYLSPSVTRLRGFSVEDAMAQTIDEAFVPESAAAMRKGIADIVAQAVAGEAEPVFRGELEQFCADGGTVSVEATVTPMRGRDGRVAGVVGVTRDISERKRTEAHIREMSLHDALTGLPNRTLFSDRLGRALSAAYREARRLAVMFIDLDKFKPVNDNYGHAVGDLLLKEVAVRMKASVRDSDTVARIGGDEFVVLLRIVEGGREAKAVAEKIREAMNMPFDVAGHRLDISCSIGIAVYPDHGKDELELSKKADDAMYWAKSHGRDAVQLYDPELRQTG